LSSLDEYSPDNAVTAALPADQFCPTGQTIGGKMRIVALVLIFTLASCTSVATRTDRNSGVGFNTYDTGAFDDG